MPKVIEWAKGPLTGVFKGCLEDPRVALHEADVNRLIQQGQGAWDAILLDVDNGPEGLTRREENDRLYDSWGVKRALWALSPMECSACGRGARPEVQGPPPERRLRRGRGAPALGGRRGARHVVWLASRPTSAKPAPAPSPSRQR